PRKSPGSGREHPTLRGTPLAAIVGGEMFERSRMPAEHRPERAAERGVVQRVLYGLDDHLAADGGEPPLAAGGDVHGLREIPRDQDSEATANPLDAPPEGHGWRS